MEVDVAARANRAATGGERTAVSTRIAAICDMIEGHREDTSLSSSQVAAISDMIDDVAAATSAETRARAGKRKRRMISVSSYEEVCTLGEGGFGVVVRARHRTTGQDVAVKSQHCQGDGILQLLREACFMAACRGHPSLVRFHGVGRVARAPGTKAGSYSLIMEYVGPNLGQVLKHRGRPFPEADVRRMMRQLLDGAVVMHRLGIVHGDINPGNILVGDDGGAVKIGDLGMAKSMEEKAVPFTFAGTAGYMAPEMLLWNTNYDTLVDTWSLGCVMAELLTSKMMPFDGKDEMDQLYKIFDVIGVPGKRAWQALKPHPNLDDEVQQWRARQRRLGHRNRLRELFPEETLSRDGFEVLKGLLSCDPKKRLTAAAALRCPWFADNNDVVDPLVADSDARAASKSWSRVWQMAISFAGRALELLRSKRLS